MRKIGILTLVLLFAMSSAAMAGLMDKAVGAAKGAAKAAAAKDVELTLSGANADLKSYEGGPYDPGKATYKTFGDADWDKLAEGAAKSAMVVTFADKVLAAADAKDEDLQAAVKALEPVAGEATKIASGITGFIGKVKSDPSKLAMLTEAKAVGDNIKTVTDKAPNVLKGLKDKIAAKAGAAK